MSQTPLRWSLPGVVALALVGVACSEVAPSNPYDRATPLNQQAPATLRGQVRLLRFGDEAAMSSVTVVLRAPGADARLGSAKPGADGRFTLNAPPGDYALEVSAPGFLTETRTLSAGVGQSLDLGVIGLQHESAGPTAVPFGGRVRLRGETDHAGTTLRIRVAGRDRAFASAVTDVTGAFEVPASRAERYRIQIERPEWRNPAGDAVYHWVEADDEEAGGHFADEAGDGATIDIELLPSDAPVCVDGEVGACVEPFGACVESRRVCENGAWGECQAKADELCDAVDNDCDGQTDEALADERACRLPNAASTCAEGRCVVVQCLGESVDVDGHAPNGCECRLQGAEGNDCNGIDEDCDGEADEDVDKRTDPRHCGACGRACDFANARSACVEGQCVLFGCEQGFYDFDDDVLTGCEAACTVTAGGVEVCDYADNDCDGAIDETHLPLEENVAHCGACENDCRRFAHGAFGCDDGVCVLLTCEPGHRDVDGDVTTGCEYACALTNGGIEACDGADNDCDGRTDEDTDLATDALHCGRCGNACTTPNAAPACSDGRCRIARCDAGWVDANRTADDGCEAACVGASERCNEVDDDCDGEVDENFAELGQPCSVGLGECRSVGVHVCVADGSGLRCGAAPGLPEDETCDAFDNDCDGSADEDFDADGDRVTTCAGDCADDAAEVHPGATERCDRRDEDCDGRVDEDFDLAGDIENCGRCGRVCELPGATARCEAGQCAIEACGRDRYDVDFLADNGCEYPCVVRNGAVETCDGRDEDCDGEADEDFRVGAPCDGRGVCGLGSLECRAGGQADCSTHPGGSQDRSGPEVCNLRDDDCDGETDEDFDLQTDAAHCGACGAACAPAGADGECVDGACVVVRCRDGRYDLDGEAENGCEYACVPKDPPDERCDGRDDDCDGATDEGFGLGALCVAEGECGAGVVECGLDGASTRCSTAPGSSADRSVPERCNMRDDDCDGAADEEVSTDLTASDPRHCGACGRVCPQRPDAIPTCTDGACGFVCAPGHIDGDGIEANGCEVVCSDPVVVPVAGGDADDIRAALARAGACGVVELSGAFTISDAAAIRIEQPGIVVRAGAQGATLTIEADADVPLFQIAASGAALRGLVIETAEGVARSIISVRRAQSVVLEGLSIVDARIGCGDVQDTGQYAAIDIDEATDVVVTDLRVVDFSFVHTFPYARECAGEWMGIVLATDSSRVVVEDSFLDMAEGSAGVAGEPFLVGLRWTHDSRVANNTITFGVDDGVAAGGDQVTTRVIRLADSHRNRISRNALTGMDRRAAEPGVGLTLSGAENVVDLNTFGTNGAPGAACLGLAVELVDLENTVRDNTYYGGAFLVLGRPRPGESVSLDTALRGMPTSRGAVVVANARSPAVQGVSVRFVPAQDCTFPPRWLSVESQGVLLVADSTDVTLAGNVTEVPQFLSGGCHTGGVVLDRVRGANVDGNVADTPTSNQQPQGCAEQSAGTLVIRGGSDVRVGANALRARDRNGTVVPGRLVTSSDAANVRMSGIELTTLLVNGADTTLEDAIVHQQAEFYSTRGVIRRLRMPGPGSQSPHTALEASGDGLRIEDSELGRRDCGSTLGIGIGGGAVEVRGLQVHCMRSSIRLTTPFDQEGQASTMRIRQTVFDFREARSGVNVRGYGNLRFENVTFAHQGPQQDALFYRDSTRPIVVRDSIIAHWPRLLTYGGAPPCCGQTPRVDVAYSDLWQLGQQTAYDLIGAGVIMTDPRFRDAANGDFRLQPGSPAIDAGDPATPVGDEPAPNGGRVNLGAYGGTAAATTSEP